jgi:folate-dependent phosphoribosylglycinamide formyltransferase PurN
MNIYIGNYIEVLESFHGKTGVDLVVAEKRNVDTKIIKYCENSGILLFLAESTNHLNGYLSSLKKKIELCIVASFGLLLDKSFLKKAKWTVNIHPGSLETCRGRHPLPFAIQKGLPFMSLTAHLIADEKIDNGPVVATLSLPIDYEKSYAYNDEKLRACLPFITELIQSQYKNEYRILTGNIDLSDAPYNKRLDGDTLNEMMSAKNLLNYKQQ